MKKLYFCRHGLSVLNAAGLWSGSRDTPLNDKGRAQAARTAQQAHGLNINLIICSPLSRARETASIIARAIGYPADKIEADDLLIERHFGELEGTPWSTNVDMEQVPGAESEASLMSRAEQIATYVRTRPEDNILIVSHGSFGRALRHALNPTIPFEATQIGNAEILELV